MTTSPLFRLHRNRLPIRIVTLLHRSGIPLHLTVLTTRLRARPTMVQQACWRLAQQGRVRWVAEGTYTLAQEEP